MHRPSLKALGASARQAILAVATAAFLISYAEPAAAMSETQDQPEIVARIDLTDLDLTSDRGADQLHRRLSLKARRYCRQSLPAIATPSMRRDCADRIVAENTGKIDRAIDDAKAMRTRS